MSRSEVRQALRDLELASASDLADYLIKKGNGNERIGRKSVDHKVQIALRYMIIDKEITYTVVENRESGKGFIGCMPRIYSFIK